jgi:hypothetical protein
MTLCVVPAIAISVAARQIYLSTTEDLSTWKGGGMGMFAAADNTLSRYAKIYILTPMGQRLPVMRLTRPQQELMLKGLWFPSESNFRALAESVKATTWWAGADQVPLGIFNENGDRVNVDEGVRFRDLRPARPGTPSDNFNYGVEVEFWKATYDVNTGDLRSVLARTFTYKE